MVALPKLVPVEEFEAFISRPENADRIFELINGEIVEVPSNIESSIIASRINRYVGNFVEEHDLGDVSGEGGGYQIGDERYAPDVAFISKDRIKTTDWFNPAPPNLAVEVDYPASVKSRTNLITKVASYLRAGVVVWCVYPEDRQVIIYAPNEDPIRLDETGVIDGGAVLPGFKLPVSKIFGEKKASE